jgi:hypothetical protein
MKKVFFKMKFKDRTCAKIKIGFQNKYQIEEQRQKLKSIYYNKILFRRRICSWRRCFFLFYLQNELKLVLSV